MKSQKAASKVKRLMIAAAACVSGACATGPQLQPPPPEECPEGARATFEAYHIGGRVAYGDLSLDHLPRVVAVKEGAVTVAVLGRYGDFPQNTVVVGRLFLGKGVAYGRFTEAQLPDGTRVPVCLEAYSQSTAALGFDLEPGSKPGSPMTKSICELVPVSRFR